MDNTWYNNPKVLIENPYQFFPSKDMKRVDVVNAMARFAIYYAIIIIVLKQDLKWLAVSVVILTVSMFLGTTEKFTSVDSTLNPPENVCQRPTKDNPFMNYTVGDLINNNNREPACQYDAVKEEMRKQFRTKIFTDPSDIWGQFISDRNFYSTPNTNIVNDQTNFAKWCFGDSGKCKSFGIDCLKFTDPVYHVGRVTNVDRINL